MTELLRSAQYRNLSVSVSSLGAASLGRHEPLEQRGELLELGLGVEVGEQRADAGVVGPMGGGEALAAPGGDDRVGATRVVLARAALDEPVALQAVDQAGQAA